MFSTNFAAQIGIRAVSCCAADAFARTVDGDADERRSEACQLLNRLEDRHAFYDLLGCQVPSQRSQADGRRY